MLSQQDEKIRKFGHLGSLDYRLIACSVLRLDKAPEEPKLEFWVHFMDLSSEDKHNMASNRKHIPCPTVNTKLSSRFYIPIGLDIAYESCFMVSLIPHVITPFQLPLPS